MCTLRSVSRSMILSGLLAAAQFACSSSWATAAYDNLSQTWTNYQQGSSGPLAASFTLNQATSIADVTLQLDSDTNAGSFMLFIANQSSGAPNFTSIDASTTVQTDATAFINAGAYTPTNYTWTLSTPLSLAAGTYWVGLSSTTDASAPTNATVDWYQVAGNLGTGVAGGSTLVGQTTSINSAQNDAFIMAVNSAVPEPKSLLVIGSGLIGLLVVRRRSLLRRVSCEG